MRCLVTLSIHRKLVVSLESSLGLKKNMLPFQVVLPYGRLILQTAKLSNNTVIDKNHHDGQQFLLKNNFKLFISTTISMTVNT